MHRHTSLHPTLLATVMALATLLIVLGGVDRIEARRPASNIPLRIEFANRVTDKMQGDGGVYEHGVGSVVAYIDRSNNSILIFGTDTGTGGRTLQFLFDTCLLTLPDTCESPFAAGFAPAGVLAGARYPAGTPVPTNGLLGMPVGGTLRADFQIQVKGQPQEWTLCMKPDGAGFCENSPTGVHGRVTRLRSDAWDFYADTAPDAWGPRSDVADLLSTTGSGKRKVIAMEGTYSLPFRFTATCVQASSCP